MAFLRLFYKKRQLLFVVFCATTFWLIYIFLSLPQPTKLASRTSFSDNLSQTQHTIRKSKEEILKDRTINNVIAVPNVVVQDGKKNEEKKTEPKMKIADSEKEAKEKKVIVNDRDSQAKKATAGKSSLKNSTKSAKSKETKGNLNMMFEKIKNKTLEMGETVKNKTLQKLSEFGVFQPKQHKKMVFLQGIWPLKISLEDVGGILKDTSYLQKEEKISINYPKLLSTKVNQTVGNETITLKNLTMTNSVGFCDCEDYDCFCCAHLEMKKMHVNNTACANFTFMTKSQEFDYRFSLDKKVIHKHVIPVEQSPSVCLGSLANVGAVCTRFLNITTKVSINDDHKLHVVGCLEFSLMLFNRTVSAFPVDCFQIPSHQHRVKEEKAINLFGNWMP